jgi:hypothetical protein
MSVTFRHKPPNVLLFKFSAINVASRQAVRAYEENASYSLLTEGTDNLCNNHSVVFCTM